MRLRSAVAALLLASASGGLRPPLAGAADNWPEFRGPHGDGRADAKGVPTKWSEAENVRWKTAIHGKGWSSPVVWGDRVWLTTVDEVTKGKEVDRATFFAVCVDRKTGAVVHDLKLFDETKPAFCHPFNSYASPTPALEDGRVYAHFGSHGTACLDSATGKVLWSRTDLKCNHFRGPGSSPILYGKLLILTFDGFDFQYVTALDKATGETVWRKDRNAKYAIENGDYKKAYSTPAVFEVGGKPQLVSPSSEVTVAYDPLTGAELWRVSHGGMNGAARPVAGHGMVYLTSGHTSQLYAFKQGLTGGVGKDAAAWKAIRGVPSRPSLLLVDDLIYMVDDKGVVSALDAKTGKPAWTDRFDGAFSASPVEADGHVYFAGENGNTYVIDAGRTFTPVATNKLDAGCMASPAAVGDALYLRTKTHLYCLGTK